MDEVVQVLQDTVASQEFGVLQDLSIKQEYEAGWRQFFTLERGYVERIRLLSNVVTKLLESNMAEGVMAVLFSEDSFVPVTLAHPYHGNPPVCLGQPLEWVLRCGGATTTMVSNLLELGALPQVDRPMHPKAGCDGMGLWDLAFSHDNRAGIGEELVGHGAEILERIGVSKQSTTSTKVPIVISI